MSDKGKIIAIFQNQEFTFAKTEITDDDMIKVGDGVHHGTILIVELDGGVIFPFGMEPGEKEAKIAICRSTKSKKRCSKPELLRLTLNNTSRRILARFKAFLHHGGTIYRRSNYGPAVEATRSEEGIDGTYLEKDKRNNPATRRKADLHRLRVHVRPGKEPERMGDTVQERR